MPASTEKPESAAPGETSEVKNIGPIVPIRPIPEGTPADQIGKDEEPFAANLEEILAQARTGLASIEALLAESKQRNAEIVEELKKLHGVTTDIVAIREALRERPGTPLIQMARAELLQALEPGVETVAEVLREVMALVCQWTGHNPALIKPLLAKLEGGGE